MKTTMDQQEGMATNRPPLFTGEDYAYECQNEIPSDVPWMEGFGSN